jgi:hypothetical protein
MGKDCFENRPVRVNLSTDHSLASDHKHRYQVLKNHITLADYEIHDGMSLEMY